MKMFRVNKLFIFYAYREFEVKEVKGKSVYFFRDPTQLSDIDRELMDCNLHTWVNTEIEAIHIVTLRLRELEKEYNDKLDSISNKLTILTRRRIELTES